MTSTAREVYERHAAAVGARDLDAVVAGYAPDAVMVDTNRIGRGHAHIRGVHAEALEAAADLRPVLTVLDEDGVVFVAWRATPENAPRLVGSDTFVVADGRITVHTSHICADAATTGGLTDLPDPADGAAGT